MLDVAYDLEEVKGEDLNWSDLSISEKAWNKVIHSGIKPVKVFAHPDVLAADSRRVSYYRMLSMVSQKSMGHVGLSINSFEIGKRILDASAAQDISRHFNSIICMLIEADDVIDEREFDLWRGMTAGSQAQGSWQNSKGEIAEELVKNLILDRIKERNPGATEHSQGRNYEVKLLDGRILTMGSEPDIAIFDQSGKIEVAIEIKGGIDAAGALERFGAAIKSLNRAKNESKSSITILIIHEASLTDTANGEIESSKSIDHMFTIGELMSRESEKSKLFGMIGI